MRDDREPAHESSARQPRGWHSRGYLPHFDGGAELPQSATFRLADSVPAAVLEGWADELASQPEGGREAELRKRIENYLDAGHGACHLRDPRIGELVEGALLHFDGVRYHLHAWVVMPNHVHVLFTPTEGHRLSDILASWKSYAANQANKILGGSGQFWQEDYFDRFIRDAEHFANAVDYIENNPVKAGLCRTPAEWPHGSARHRPSAGNVVAAGTAALPGRRQEEAARMAALPGKAAARTAPPPQEAEFATATFRIDWHGRRIEAEVRVPTAPVRPRHLLPMVQQLAVAVAELGSAAAVAQGKTISCKAGCGACCRQVVPITETEARHIRDVVEALPEPRRTVVRERFAAARAKLAEAGLLETFRNATDIADRAAAGTDYFRLGIACPFLEDESCSIHPDRPLSCREYLVTNPAENCQAPSRETIRQVILPARPMPAFATLDGRLPDGRTRWVPLILAPEWADAHPEPDTTEPGAKLFASFMAALGDTAPPLPTATPAAPPPEQPK
jgi:REP element-mobilizing transposase RayT/Fe-S-cluster containining protein